MTDYVRLKRLCTQMAKTIDSRLTAAETRLAARTPPAGVFSLADWEAERAAHAGESPAQWLARMTAPANLARWPAEKRERMAEQYRTTAATVDWMNLEGML